MNCLSYRKFLPHSIVVLLLSTLLIGATSAQSLQVPETNATNVSDPSKLEQASRSQSVGEIFEISEKYKPGDDFMATRLLGAVRLNAKKMKGEKPRELSGLAWDDDERLLLAISDDGFIVHLEPEITNSILTGLKVAGVYPLYGEDGKQLTKSLGDAEGLVGHNMSNRISGDSYVSISFEERPRIQDFSLQGEFLRSHELPESLRSINNYADKNQELESLTIHPVHGMLTAPERPLETSGTQFFSLYNLTGDVWHYPSLDHKNSALVGMETMPNGNILVLERRFASLFQPIIFALRELNLSAPELSEAKLVREVIHFNSSDAWKIDNFEAVAHHTENRYFVISDDNESVFQKTLLIYLEIKDFEAGSPRQ